MSWLGENLGTFVALLASALLVLGLAPRLVPRIGAINLNGNKITIIATVVFVILTIAVYLIGTPTMRGTWEYGKAHWPMIIFLSLAGYIIAMLLPDGATDAEKSRQKKIKGAVQGVAVVIPVFYFILAPLAMKAEEWTLPTVTCPKASDTATRECVINASWTWYLLPEDPYAVAGKRLCFTPRDGVEFEQLDTKSGTLVRFRAKEGVINLRYKLKQMGDCPSSL